MALLGDAFSFLQRIATIDVHLETLQRQADRLQANLDEHSAQIADLRERVARLEEARHTVRAEVETELVKAVREIERRAEALLREWEKRKAPETPALLPPKRRRK